ncbi:MAG: nucleolar complex protein 14 [Icmadophila ericetorum]|nr:nucleolar complex protein 14 [Icmadophila ericetorum]
MAPSQLKRLKTSLREQGIVGPQQSKKQKKQAGKNGVTKEKRVQRSAVLEKLREQFNPFEVKKPARPNKYDFVKASTNGSTGKGVVGRPGVTKGLGEEMRRKTLLVEMQRRQKVGGILDRRFGENDPTMTPEEKALERFVKEKQRSGAKKGSLFNLEDDEDDQEELTHFGRALSLTASGQVDDFDEAGLDGSDEEDPEVEDERRSRKRRRLSDDESGRSSSDEREKGNKDAEAVPKRVKTKVEVMKEVIAKSKLHKYERQKAKEDDDDLRAELDQGLPDIYALLQGRQRTSEMEESQAPNSSDAAINPDRAALLAGKDRLQSDKEYDERLRQMAFDARAKPTERTKPEEERLKEEAEKLKILEEKRLARMQGEGDDSDNASENLGPNPQGDEDFEDFGEDENQRLDNKTPIQPERLELGVEDEDDFVLDDDLIASDSEPSNVEETEDSVSDVGSEDDKEFIGDLLTKDDLGRIGFDASQASETAPLSRAAASMLAFTYACPQTHDELLAIVKDIAIEDLATTVQRIRALHHPKLQAENKAKMAGFASVLVDHISYLASLPHHPPFAVLEQLIRHVHSLAKSFPIEVGTAFRTHLKSIHDLRPTAPTAGDLVLLTAIASTFPTSDHFHQVVTPAMLSMGRYLGQKIPKAIGDLVKGAFVCTLCLQYQQLSKRYIPEVVNYVLNALCALAPSRPSGSLGLFTLHDAPSKLRITSSSSMAKIRKMRFWDIDYVDGADTEKDEELKLSLFKTFLDLSKAMAELWMNKSAYYEIFQPFDKTLDFLRSKACSKSLGPHLTSLIHVIHDTLRMHLDISLRSRKPLALHNHRPQAIKTSIPKFEESYNPSRHYDPDQDRTELKKLKAEHKRERKGALRELRKDASFIARESLREKKERDEAYEKKYKRLVAEIQGEEGREGNAYEREKRRRKGGK